MTLTFDLLTSKSIGHILDSWWVSVWSFMIIGWLQSQLSSGNHFQITMRHDLDLWPFDLKINRAHPWLMGSKCMKFHDHRWITESVIVRKLVWRTDGRTDRQTDRVQTYSPLRFHRWGTKKIDYTRLRTDLGRSVLSVKCQQTGVDIDYPNLHNSLTINWARFWKISFRYFVL